MSPDFHHLLEINPASIGGSGPCNVVVMFDNANAAERALWELCSLMAKLPSQPHFNTSYFHLECLGDHRGRKEIHDRVHQADVVILATSEAPAPGPIQRFLDRCLKMVQGAVIMALFGSTEIWTIRVEAKTAPADGPDEESSRQSRQEELAFAGADCRSAVCAG